MRFVPLSNAFDSKVKLKMLRFLYGNFVPMSGRELAKVVGVSNASVSRVMHEFYELDLVYPKRIGNVVIWERNEKSLAFTELKKIVNQIKQLPSPKEHMVGTIRAGLTGQPVVRAVIFGSVAEGRERSGSDIDLFILTPNEDTKSSLSAKLNELLEKCLELYGNSLSPLILTKKEFENPTNKYLMENIRNGLIIVPEVNK